MRISTSQFQEVSIGSVLDQQAKLSKLQQQLATGRRILTPADDPAGAAQALQLAGKIEHLERLQQNATLAQNRLAQEETALDKVDNVLQRVRELSIQANNDSNSANDRRLIAAELRERFDELVQIANADDGNGEYLFAGVASRDAPFAVSGGRQVAYLGDQTERFVQVGPTRQLAVNHTGFDVFMRVGQGNGTFVTSADSGNTGTGVVDDTRVRQPGNATYPYTVSFATDPVSGDLQYTITGGSGPVTGNYEAGAAIAIDGIEITLSGTPDDGDSFEIQAAAPRSVFATVDDLITALEGADDAPAARAQLHNVVNNTLANLDQAHENVVRVRAEVGARLHAIDAEISGNEDSALGLKTTLSELEDLDYADAISKFNLQLVGLQAAQQSYVKIQGLSLFNYL